MSENGQSHSQSQTRLLFVTTLEMDNFDYTIMINAYFINSQLVLGRGSFTREAYIASPVTICSSTNSFRTQLRTHLTY